MKRKIRKFMAFALSGTAVLTGPSMADASAMAVQATPSTAEPREIQMEDREDTFRVLLPTVTDEVFDFIMDPQQLISKTEAAAYGGLTFEEGATLFFRRTDEDAQQDYSSFSDSLVITNMGTADVNIVLNARISLDPAMGITMTDDIDFSDDTDTSLYLALTDGENTVPINEEGVSIYTTLEGTSGEEGDCNYYRFRLLGAVNTNGDWAQIVEAAPKVTVTWSVVPEGSEGSTENRSFGEDGFLEENQNIQEQEIGEQEETLESAIMFEGSGGPGEFIISEEGEMAIEAIDTEPPEYREEP